MLIKSHLMSKKLKWFHSNLKEKKFSDEIKIKLNGKGIYPNTGVKYLDVKVE